MFLRKRQAEAAVEATLAMPQALRPLLLHPVFIFSLVWLGVTTLYAMHLSKVLMYSSQEAFATASYLWLPFVATIAAYSLFHHLAALAYPRKETAQVLDLSLLERRLALWFRIWVVVTIFETAISGGLPIIWLITHSSKTYQDFGISSLHGLVNSLLMSISICRFVLFLLTRNKRHLLVPAFAIFWSVIAVTRNLMIVVLIEYVIIAFQLRPIRTATLMKIVAGFLCLILAFGVIGDLRQGSSEAFRLLAQPTDQFPEWLPSGVLWAYIYITTPINNLIYTMNLTKPADNLLFPYTAALLFPTVLRGPIYGKTLSDAESGQMVTAAFNVSTAYVGPYQDYGLIGIGLFSALAAVLCQAFWYRRNLFSVLGFAVLAQCLILTLFFNHFFNLPVIFQLVWLTYFLLPKINVGFVSATQSPLAFKTRSAE